MGYIAETELVKICSDICSYKGIDAYRINQLFDGEEDKEDLEVPEIKIFTENKYKHLEIPDISIDKLSNIIAQNRNVFTETNHKSKVTQLYCFKSFINHSRDENLKLFRVKNIMFIYALHDITKGQELVIDYCPAFRDIEDAMKRKMMLYKYGI